MQIQGDGTPPEWGPAWSFTTPGTTPAPNKIAFSGGTGFEDIFTMNPDGSGVTRVGTLGDADHPTWSGDGCIAATAAYVGVRRVYDLMVMNGDGKGLNYLPTTLQTLSPKPAWSPDGTKIAFATSVTGNSDIYVINTDGTGETLLTKDMGASIAQYVAQHPTWSPDGKKIAFQSDHQSRPDDRTPGIWVMNAAGSGLARLNSDGTEPAWSPDGSTIAFTSARGGTPQVWVMNAAGGGETLLSSSPGEGHIAAGWYPAWSPDGKKIAYNSHPVDGSLVDQIWVMNPDGSGATQLTRGRALDYGAIHPSWSR